MGFAQTVRVSSYGGRMVGKSSYNFYTLYFALFTIYVGGGD